MREVRRRRLQKLVDDSGGPAAFARNRSTRSGDGINPTYVSQLLNGHRQFGEKAARSMESRAGLQPFYLDGEVDQLLTAASLDADEWLLLKGYRLASPERKAIMLGIARESVPHDADR